MQRRAARPSISICPEITAEETATVRRMVSGWGSRLRPLEAGGEGATQRQLRYLPHLVQGRCHLVLVARTTSAMMLIAICSGSRRRFPDRSESKSGNLILTAPSVNEKFSLSTICASSHEADVGSRCFTTAGMSSTSGTLRVTMTMADRGQGNIGEHLRKFATMGCDGIVEFFELFRSIVP